MNGRQLKRHLSTNPRGRLPSDAQLAAFAESAGMRVATFDKYFERFEGLECVRLIAARH